MMTSYSPTVKQFYDEALSAPAKSSANASFLASHRDGKNPGNTASFSGLAGPLENVAEKLLGGWDEGARKMEQSGAGFKLPPIPSIRRKVKFGAQGDELDIHTVRNGRIDRAWRSAPRQQTTGPARVHIVIDNGAACRVDAGELVWRGVAGLVLARALSSAGYDVRIDVATAVNGLLSGHNGETLDDVTLLTVKGYRAPLNVTALAGVVAHPAGFRRMFFAHLIQQATGEVRASLGWAADVTPGKLPAWFPHQFSDKATLLVIPRTLLSEQAARNWLTQSLHTLLPGA